VFLKPFEELSVDNESDYFLVHYVFRHEWRMVADTKLREKSSVSFIDL